MLSAASRAASAIAAASPSLSWGSGGSNARTRTLPKSVDSEAFTPTEDFLERLEEAELHDSQTMAASSGIFATPQRKVTSRLANELTPPGAPEPERRSSRLDAAIDFIEMCVNNSCKKALAAWHTAEEMGKAAASSATKAAEEVVKASINSASKAGETVKKAVGSKKAKAPGAKGAKAAEVDKENTAPTAKKAQGAGAKPKKGLGAATKQQQAQPKKATTKPAAAAKPAPLSPRARAAAETAAKVEAAAKPKGGAAKGSKARAGASDPLARHGYATQGPIAAGAFSTIVRAVAAETGSQVAVKSFDNNKCAKDYQHLYLRDGELAALREVQLGSGPSKWVANMIEEHTGPQFTYAILEYCAGGSLQRYLQKLTTKGRDRDGNMIAIPESDCAYMGAQINAALRHLHKLDVAHRDLKPGNVLFAGDKWLKLCDFGFAKRCRGQRLHTICGTPIYMAPELTMDQKKGYKGHPVDMWAFGAMMYEMLHNKLAFNGVSAQQLNERIRSGKHAPLKSGLSKASGAPSPPCPSGLPRARAGPRTLRLRLCS